MTPVRLEAGREFLYPVASIAAYAPAVVSVLSAGRVREPV
jgi:hypothetical protein